MVTSLYFVPIREMYPQFQEVYKPLKSVMDTCDNIYSPRPLLNVWFFLQFSLRFVHACLDLAT